MKLVGIIMRLEKFDTTWKWFINQSYVTALSRLQCHLFPICQYEALAFAIQHCDALLIPGGYDIHGYYLQEPLFDTCTCYDTPQDHFDFQCIQQFEQANKPILGICRGMQMLNIYYGGTLLQHINTEKHAINHTHSLQIPERSHLRQLYSNPITVNSFHHQVVGKLGKGLRSTAFSDDMYVEAFLHENKRVMGVQWHPEKMEDDQILPYFFDIICQPSHEHYI